MSQLRILLVSLWIAAIGGICLVACVTPEQQTAAAAFAETVSMAAQDGVITQDEADAIQVKMKAYIDAPKTDWLGMAGTALGTVAAGFFGLRYLPNSVIIGKQEAAHLEKASGVS